MEIKIGRSSIGFTILDSRKQAFLVDNLHEVRMALNEMLDDQFGPEPQPDVTQERVMEDRPEAMDVAVHDPAANKSSEDDLYWKAKNRFDALAHIFLTVMGQNPHMSHVAAKDAAQAVVDFASEGGKVSHFLPDGWQERAKAIMTATVKQVQTRTAKAGRTATKPRKTGRA